MRITNEMMNNTSLTNINRNKTYLDKLNTQMSSEKKITRPSDDPIIAIRALRLRNNLSEITQYYKNNVPDAEKWVNATTDAIESTSKIVSSMRSQFVEGSNGPNTTEDRKAILEELKGLRDQIYDNGNADYAGRTLFTGYRTGVKLTFEKDTTRAYRDITEGFNASDIESLTYVKGKVSNENITNVSNPPVTPSPSKDETTVEAENLSRIRLAYDNLDVAQDGAVEITYRTAFTATSAQTATGFTISATTPAVNIVVTKHDTVPHYTATGGTITENDDGTLTVKDGSGNIVNLSGSGQIVNAYTEATLPVTIKQLSNGADDAYTNGATTLIPETGELILSDADKATLSKLVDIEGVPTIEFKYDKTDWVEDDLRPEHYFNCYDVTDATNAADPADPGRISYTSHDQEICYDVTAKQSMRVNTFASEVFTHDIGRDVDEAIRSLQEVDAAQAKVDAITKLKSDTSVDQDEVTKLLDAANKELTLLKDKSQKFFEGKLTTFQGYIDRTVLASTNAGTRSSRLELVENRLADLQTNARELQKDNENVEVTEIAIEVSSAELVYNAALLATGKISQQSLLNYL